MRKTKIRNEKIIPFNRVPEFYNKIGLKSAYRKKYIHAARYLEKAISLAPFDLDYRFNLAAVYAESGDLEKSNSVLKYIILYIDPTMSECYFGIGCNYYELEEFDKSAEYFEKYIYFDPNGEYAEDVSMGLQYLKMDLEEDLKRIRKTFDRYFTDGLKLLKEGAFPEACSRIEYALELEPADIEARNILSILYFKRNYLEKAEVLARSVLKLDEEDIAANCNLAVYFSFLERNKELKQQVKAILGLRISDKEELEKVLDTLIKLNEFGGIKKALKNYLGNKTEFVRVLEETLDLCMVQEEKRREVLGSILTNSGSIRKKQSRTTGI